jgi:hypothetical protein
MTTPKRRTRQAASEPTTKPHRAKVAKANTAGSAEQPRSEASLAATVATPSAVTPETLASGSPLRSETEGAARAEAPVETASTTPTPSPAESVAPANKWSALDAAAKVLGETGQALSCAELIAAMASKGYWQSPRGRTPAGTLYAAILRELQTKGDKARFCKTERGKFRFNTAL